MPTYTLVPDEHDFEPEQLMADSPSQLLGMVYGYGWNSAQVFDNGSFLFVVQNVSGVWTIMPGLPGEDTSPAIPG